MLLVVVAGCCCCFLLLLVVVAGCCCCFLLLLVVVVVVVGGGGGGECVDICVGVCVDICDSVCVGVGVGCGVGGDGGGEGAFAAAAVSYCWSGGFLCFEPISSINKQFDCFPLFRETSPDFGQNGRWSRVEGVLTLPSGAEVQSNYGWPPKGQPATLETPAEPTLTR